MSVLMEQCPCCFGRGYKPRYRQKHRHGGGFYAATCSACNGRGERPVKVKRAKAKAVAAPA